MDLASYSSTNIKHGLYKILITITLRCARVSFRFLLSDIGLVNFQECVILSYKAIQVSVMIGI